MSQSVSRESIIGTENEFLHRGWPTICDKRIGRLFLSVVCFFDSGSGGDHSISGITDSWLGTFDNQFWDWIQFNSPMTMITLFFFIFTFFFYDLIKFFDIVERRRRFAFTASNTLKMRLAQSVAKEALYRLLFLPFAFNLCDFQKKIVIDLLKFCRDITRHFPFN